MHAGLVERVRLEADLRVALENDDLEVHYQPLINMRSGQISGVEALARWQHPVLGAIPPSEFIPLAESSGLIRALGEWVLREACTQTVTWRRGDVQLSDLGINVNVSARQLYDGDMTGTVSQVLEETGLAPGCLTLEMTESVLLDDSGETLSTLRAIRALGVRLAIDDFGTGYSSLSDLHRFPVDVLKIDRSFIERLLAGRGRLAGEHDRAARAHDEPRDGGRGDRAPRRDADAATPGLQHRSGLPLRTGSARRRAACLVMERTYDPTRP